MRKMVVVFWFGQSDGGQPHAAAFDNEVWGRPPSTCNVKYKIWRPCWRILKQNKRKARKSVDTVRNNLDGDVTKSYRKKRIS